MTGCGGCAGLGSHQRWCPAVVGARAARLGRTADDLDDLGDTLPPDLANVAWRLAEQLRVLAGAPVAAAAGVGRATIARWIKEHQQP